MFGLGPMELIIVFLVILLIFGAKRIPEIAQGLGKGITEFKKAAREVTTEIDSATDAGKYSPPPPPQQQQKQQQQPVQNELREEKRVENSPQQS